MLLKHISDATCYEDLLVCRGPDLQPIALPDGRTHHAGWREAVVALGLFEDDRLAKETFEEAVRVLMPSALRRLFVMLLGWLEVQEPLELWQAHWEAICQDLLHDSKRKQVSTSAFAEAHAQSLALKEMHQMCFERGIDPDIYLPPPPRTTLVQRGSKELQRESNYDRSEQATELARLLPLIKSNPEQSKAWDAIQDALAGGPQNVIFLEAQGGSGKTTLYLALLADVRSKGEIALPQAFGGLPAQISVEEKLFTVVGGCQCLCH